MGQSAGTCMRGRGVGATGGPAPLTRGRSGRRPPGLPREGEERAPVPGWEGPSGRAFRFFFLWTVQRGLGPGELALQLGVGWQNTLLSGSMKLTPEDAPFRARVGEGWTPSPRKGRWDLKATLPHPVQAKKPEAKSGEGGRGWSLQGRALGVCTPSSLQAGPLSSQVKLRLESRVGFPWEG